jgi:hypothetical protein
MKKENEVDYNETCSTSDCGCAVNYIWGGVAVILFIMAIAMMFGK